MFGEAKFRCIYVLYLIEAARQTRLGNSILKEERGIFMGIVLHRKIKSILWNAWRETLTSHPALRRETRGGGRNKKKALDCHCSLA